MSDRAEYLALLRLKNSPDYKVLEARWLYKFSQIQAARDAAASSDSRSNWRFYAGQEKGAQIIMLSLDLSIKELEEADEELLLERKHENLLREVRGEVI